MASSVGGLFLQVKLQTDDAERALKRLGREFSAAVSPDKAVASATRAIVAEANAAGKAQVAAGRAAQAAARQAESSAKVQVASLKAATQASKERVSAVNAEARASEAAARTQRANALAGVEAQRIAGKLSILGTQDALIRQRREEAAAAKAAAAAERELAAAMKGTQSSAQSMFRVIGTGGTDLFTGLGAARSGNYFYGVAALGRYFGNVTSAARSLSPAMVGVAGGIVAVGVAAIGTAAALTLLTSSLVETGTAGATNLEFLRAQMRALIGDATEADKEFQFLLDLGKRSIVPTSDLIEADRTLLSFGVSIGVVRRNLVQFISDWGSATGATQMQVGNLSYALGQVSSTGKVTAIDLRQMGTAGINTAALIGGMAKSMGKSTTEIREGLSAGTIDANMFYAALVQYGQGFKSGAEATSNTLQGLQQNTRETFNTMISQAFLTAGALKPLEDVLRAVQQFLISNPNLFAPMADAARELFSAIGEVFSAFSGTEASSGGSFVVSLFRDVIPGAIRVTASVVRSVASAVRSVWPVFRAVFTALWQGFSGLSAMGEVVKAAMVGVAVSIGIGISAFAALAAAMSVTWGMFAALINVARALGAALTGNFSAAGEYLRSAAVDALAGFTRAYQIAQAVAGMWKGAVGGTSAGKSPAEKAATGARGGGGGGEKAADTGAQTEAAKAAAQKLATARNSIYELLQRYFGQPSEALAGLYGDSGKFDATVSSIVSTAKRLYDAVVQAAPGGASSGIARFLDRQTRVLIALAKQRDKVAEKLKLAQEKLDKLVSERNDFAAGIKSAALEFVNSFAVGEETITKYTRLDAVGSFVMEQTKSTKSYVVAMRERLAAYRKFMADIKRLQKRGLDPALIRKMIEAGPEAAGAAAAELAGSSSATIDEVNKMQAELGSEAKRFGNDQGDIYYKTGLENATKLVNGLKAKAALIDTQARAITTSILAAVEPLAAKMQEAGTAAGAGMATGIGAGLAGGLGGLTDVVVPPLTGVTDAMRSALNPDTARQQATTWVDNIRNALVTLLTNARDTVAPLFDALWPDSVDLSGILTSVTSFFTSLPATVSNAVGGIWSWVQRNIPLPDFSGVFERVVSFFANLPNNAAREIGHVMYAFVNQAIPIPDFSGVFAGVKSFFQNLPGSLAASIGNPWGFITSKLPGAQTVANALATAFSKVKTVLTTWANNIKSWNPFIGLTSGFKSVMHSIVDLWNRIDFGIHLKAPAWLGGWSFDINDIFPDIVNPFAKGGIVTKPMLGMVGEAGSNEAIIPLNRSGLSDAFGDVMGSAPVMVETHTYIGDRELVDIVDSRVIVHDQAMTQRVFAGRRL